MSGLLCDSTANPMDGLTVEPYIGVHMSGQDPFTWYFAVEFQVEPFDPIYGVYNGLRRASRSDGVIAAVREVLSQRRFDRYPVTFMVAERFASDMFNAALAHAIKEGPCDPVERGENVSLATMLRGRDVRYPATIQLIFDFPPMIKNIQHACAAAKAYYNRVRPPPVQVQSPASPVVRTTAKRKNQVQLSMKRWMVPGPVPRKVGETVPDVRAEEQAVPAEVWVMQEPTVPQ